jgi:hypothetical protein
MLRYARSHEGNCDSREPNSERHRPTTRRGIAGQDPFNDALPEETGPVQRTSKRINRTDGPRIQVDFGKDETALIRSWQGIEKIH